MYLAEPLTGTPYTCSNCQGDSNYCSASVCYNDRDYAEHDERQRARHHIQLVKLKRKEL